jgi:aspartate racemase
MMTNLGHLEFAVEFTASELIAALSNKRVEDIVTEAGKKAPIVHKLGILTGNGPESGILLWQKINSRIRNHPSRKISRMTPHGQPREYTSKLFRGDISFPAVLVESLPGMGLSMELALRESEVRGIVLKGARSLCERGSTVVGIACNTSQYFADDVAQLCEGFGVRFVKTADETARYLRKEGIEAFDFLGIGAVADFARWSGYGKALAGFDIRIPSAEILPEIDKLAHLIKQQVVSSTTRNKGRDLIDRGTYTQVVVLALTELSVLFSQEKAGQKSGKRFVDTLEVLAETMAEIYIQEYVEVDRPLFSEEDANEAD